jgi:hypothetical protein
MRCSNVGIAEIVRRAAFPIVLLLLSACSTSARLYAVEGPLNAGGPTPPLDVKVDGILGNNGKLSFAKADGVECSGEWSSAAGSGVSVTSGSLIGTYGASYLSAVSVSSGSGQNPGLAFAQCADGTTFDIEFVTGSGTASGFGIARDSAGNIYRLLF